MRSSLLLLVKYIKSLNLKTYIIISITAHPITWGHRGRGRDCMVVGFTTTPAISAYHHYSCEFESHSWKGVLDTTLCDKDCQ